ncbi:hypothetical protein C0Q70_08500 [Pomacea canaliculata]|uniref:Rhodanese domain-containing protein n=2 Tax=Pomacea canaliculata TaxID=400727 RepID=A0A2T7PI11_POMCA|nr:hypothetical protein C0Q70_08500 [Pomacea canaliculata]
MIRAKFPTVEYITTNTLTKWLGRADERKIILMDCRAPEEYNVSHLEGAHCVDWKNGDPCQLLSSLPSDKPHTVVCYCSVGYRSSVMAQKLQQYLATAESAFPVGSISVYNLEGSLFKWANEGRPMVDSRGQATRMCHPFSATWGLLLEKQLRNWGSSEK